MTDIIDEAKRLKAFDKVFVWLGKNKMTLKDLDNPDEHFTMLVTQDGILDVHTTKEGSEKEYESLAKVDLKKLGEELQNNPNIMNDFETKIRENIKEVNFDEPEFLDCKIANVKNKEEISALARKEKRNVIIPNEAVNDDVFIAWNLAKDKVREKAMVYDKNNTAIGYLFREGEKFYFIKGDFFIGSYLFGLVSKLASQLNQDKQL